MTTQLLPLIKQIRKAIRQLHRIMDSFDLSASEFTTATSVQGRLFIAERQTSSALELLTQVTRKENETCASNPLQSSSTNGSKPQTAGPQPEKDPNA